VDKRERFIEKLRNIAIQTPTNDIEVPEKVEGFGTIDYKAQTCSACKKCIEACEPAALDFDLKFMLPDYIDATIPEEGFRSKNRETLVSLLQTLKAEGDVQAISVPVGLAGYGMPDWISEKCIACSKCIEACPEDCLTLQNIYKLPEIIGEIEPLPALKPPADWKPFIVCFVCWECSHAAADLAGLMHLHYPTTVRTVRVPCSGAVEPIHIMTAMEKGADGVLVTGCLLHECHYGGEGELAGNFMQLDFVHFWERIFKEIGLEGRLHIDFASAAMGIRFAEIVSEFSGQITKLGPSPLRAKLEDE
jgi:coenzyme F420-reducing hydrogenase delta subunit/Na+-translocating ferredoxin:NAD+ oxidoreductase RNF subunit RnfB